MELRLTVAPREAGRCARCGGEMAGDQGLLAFVDGRDRLVCLACAEGCAPEVVRALRAVPFILGEDPRGRLLAECARREPGAFRRFRGRVPVRGGAEAPGEEYRIGVRQTEELLEGDDAVQVFVPRNMPTQEAVRVLYRMLMLLYGAGLATCGTPLGG